MVVHRVIRCDCGFEAVAATDGDLVAQAQTHALDAHGTDVTADVLLALARPQRKEE